MAGQSLPPEAIVAALQAAHKTGVATDPNAGADPAQGGGGAQAASQGAQSGSVDPTQAGADQQDPNAQGQDPNEQAVWQEFPATDPQNIQQLAEQMQSEQDPAKLVDLLGQFMQQSEADTAKLSQMHEAMLSQLMDLLQGPGGGEQPQGDPSQGGPEPVGAQGPGVGGTGTGY